MEQTKVKEAIQPIVNGSFNHEMTNEEMLAFDIDTKRSMAWSLIVSMEFAHSFRDVDPKVFTVVPSQFTHDMLTAERLDEILVTVRTEFQQRHKQLLTLTSNYYYKLGQEISKAQKELGFGGFLRMDFRKLIGYVVAGGSWNEYDHNKVSDAIRELDQLAPKFYKRNNCNNGMKKHDWTTTGEYLTMVVTSADKDEVEQWLQFYKEHWQRVGHKIQADSVRYELVELGHGYSSIEFVYWWD